MYEWYKVIQKMIDWIEINIEDNPSLLEMSNQIGYSPCYCSYLFHHISEMTLKKYMAGRRLCCATMELRDTTHRILDIAVKYGFSSQEAFTRAFLKAYGCTPYAYRKNPIPIPLSIKKVVLHPHNYIDEGDNNMCNLKDVNVRFEHIPAHKYIGIWDINAKNYGEFWQKHDCDEVCGVIESMRNVALSVVGCHMAGWFYEGNTKGYFYGFDVSSDYDGVIPKGFEMREFPASDYLVFFHPTFDYVSENAEVMRRVEDLAWNYNPQDGYKWWIPKGYEWNEDICQDYQRHFPEVLGYEVLRPVKKIRNYR